MSKDKPNSQPQASGLLPVEAVEAQSYVPPFAKAGKLRRAVFKIPNDQKKILESDSAWFANLMKNGFKGAIVPNNVIDQLSHQDQPASNPVSSSLPVTSPEKALDPPVHVANDAAATMTTTTATTRVTKTVSLNASLQTATSEAVASNKAEEAQTNGPSSVPGVSVPEVVAENDTPIASVEVSEREKAPEDFSKDAAAADMVMSSVAEVRQYSPDWPEIEDDENEEPEENGEKDETEGGDEEQSKEKGENKVRKENKEREQDGNLENDKAQSQRQKPQKDNILVQDTPFRPSQRVVHAKELQRIRSSSPLEELEVRIPQVLYTKQTLRKPAGPAQSIPQVTSNLAKKSPRATVKLVSNNITATATGAALQPRIENSASRRSECGPHSSNEAFLQQRRRLMKRPAFSIVDASGKGNQSAAARSEYFLLPKAAEIVQANQGGQDPATGSLPRANVSIRGKDTPLPSSESTPKRNSNSHSNSHSRVNTPVGASVVEAAITTAYPPPAGDSSAERARAAAQANMGKLAYQSFTSAYPDYRGSLDFFLKACVWLQCRKAKSIDDVMFDDMIRAFVDYIEYVNEGSSADSLKFLAWYYKNTDLAIFNKGIVARSKLPGILSAYPDKVASFAQSSSGSSNAGKTSSQAAAGGVPRSLSVDGLQSPVISIAGDEGGDAALVENLLLAKIAQNDNISPPDNVLSVTLDSDGIQSSWLNSQRQYAAMQAHQSSPRRHQDLAIANAQQSREKDIPATDDSYELSSSLSQNNDRRAVLVHPSSSLYPVAGFTLPSPTPLAPSSGVDRADSSPFRSSLPFPLSGDSRDGEEGQGSRGLAVSSPRCPADSTLARQVSSAAVSSTAKGRKEPDRGDFESSPAALPVPKKRTAEAITETETGDDGPCNSGEKRQRKEAPQPTKVARLVQQREPDQTPEHTPKAAQKPTWQTPKHTHKQTPGQTQKQSSRPTANSAETPIVVIDDDEADAMEDDPDASMLSVQSVQARMSGVKRKGRIADDRPTTTATTTTAAVAARRTTLAATDIRSLSKAVADSASHAQRRGGSTSSSVASRPSVGGLATKPKKAKTAEEIHQRFASYLKRRTQGLPHGD